MPQLLSRLAVVGVLAFSANANADVIVIDDFNTALTPSTTLTTFGGTVPSDSQTAVGILGSRVVSVTQIAGGGSASALIDTSLHAASASTATVGDSAAITYTYTFASRNFTSSSSLNLLIATDNGRGGPTAGLATLLVNNGGGLVAVGSAQQTNATGVAITNSPLVFGFGSTPRNSLTQIQLRFDLADRRGLTFAGSPNFALNATENSSIPEPATPVVLGVAGLAGLVGALRKRNSTLIA